MMTANFASPDFFSRRATESQIAYEMRIRPYLHHREDAQADADQGHAEFRQQQEARTQGSGFGLMGDASPQQRAAALNSHGFGGNQTVERNGGIGYTSAPGQVAVGRIYASQIENDQPAVSPLTAHLRSSGVGWH